MWLALASILVINTLTMLTIAHADRGKSTLKDDERFRNGLVCEYKHEAALTVWNSYDHSCIGYVGATACVFTRVTRVNA